MRLKNYMGGLPTVRYYIVNQRTYDVLHKVDAFPDKYIWDGNLAKTPLTTPATFYSTKEADKVAQKYVSSDSFYFMDRDGLTVRLYNMDGTKK